jgi:DNA-binding LacI/PurR family transcriptional regulator
MYMSSSTSIKKKYVSRAASLETVEQTLRARIATGYWPPGIMLPSRRDLAKEFDVDLHTIQRAILPLLGDGTLQANGGRGTFVAGEVSADGQSVSTPSPLPDASRTVPQTGETPPRAVGTLGIIAAYDTSRNGAFDVAGVGTRDILRPLEWTFSEAGGKTVFFNLFRADGPWVTVPEAGEALLAQGVEALAIVGIQNGPLLGDVLVAEDTPGTVPIIHISGAGSYQPLIHVFYDQRQAGYQAAEHLLKIGCRRLMFLVPFAAPWLEERVEGARIALRDARLPADALRVFPADHSLGAWSEAVEAASTDAIRHAFAANLIEEGVITPNDGIAHLFLTIAEDWGRRPGRDFALIGFDDVPQSSFCGMTSIRPPFEEMGREAALLLLRCLAGEKVHLNICLRSHLMVRDSTARFVEQRAGRR